MPPMQPTNSTKPELENFWGGDGCDKSNRPEPMKTWECRTAKELTTEIFERWSLASELCTVGHAAYIGREAQKAEQCLYSGQHYQQD